MRWAHVLVVVVVSVSVVATAHARVPDGATYVPLAGTGSAELAWALDEAAGTVSFAVRTRTWGAKYVALGIGTRMSGTTAYVGWTDDDGAAGGVAAYYMSGYSGSAVEATGEQLDGWDVTRIDGYLTVYFTRSLVSRGPVGRRLQAHVDPPDISLDGKTPFVYAIGRLWTAGTAHGDTATSGGYHNMGFSRTATRVELRTGAASTDDIDSQLVTHGVLMAVAYVFCFHFGAVAIRALRAFKNPLFFRAHQALMGAGVVLSAAGFAVSYEWADGNHFRSSHSKLGLAILVLSWTQALNGVARPGKPKSEEAKSVVRRAWELFHVSAGRVAVVLGLVNTFTGLHRAKDYGAGDTTPSLAAVLCVVALFLVALAYVEFSSWRARQPKDAGAGAVEMGTGTPTPTLMGDAKSKGSSM